MEKALAPVTINKTNIPAIGDTPVIFSRLILSPLGDSEIWI
jgi:hypothetical protein